MGYFLFYPVPSLCFFPFNSLTLGRRERRIEEAADEGGEGGGGRGGGGDGGEERDPQIKPGGRKGSDDIIRLLPAD